ncbi:TLD family protein [Tritrichomonas foetus]|uniref:Oxidation resistance protein 1 n=1 Tax=Tritrichomonas foetus TaxID=1144522 RepID=A0A1J4KLS7_9EUKA|nr:TLD family protein [Tritrichomonas foetus]|eukprot:OHT12171.1 TLD family protein [Tritrichomonas foetus]
MNFSKSFSSRFFNHHHHISREHNEFIIGTQNPIILPSSDEPCDETSPNPDSKPIGDEDDKEIPIEEDEYGRSSIPIASSLPKFTSPKSYFVDHEVKEGETLQTIAEKYKIPVSLLKSANRIYGETVNPGEILKIVLDMKVSNEVEPINVSLFDAKDEANNLKGKLYLKDFFIVFKPNSIIAKKIRINLVGHLESAVMPHPDVGPDGEMLFVLVVNYLKDPNDHHSMCTHCFTGHKRDLEKYQCEILKAADLAQVQNNYKAPNPDAIAYSENGQTTENNRLIVKIDLSPPSDSSLQPHQLSKKSSKSMIYPKSKTRSSMIFLPKIEFLNGKSDIFSPTDIFNLRKKLPRRYQNSNWSLLYKMSIDGSSVATLFSKTEKQKPLLLFIKTNKNEVIGSFISAGFTIGDNYNGSGETFVFSLQPTFDAYMWNSVGSNNFFVSASKTDIRIGGGGATAIYIDGNMLKAVSEPCPTFGSPSLTSDPHFKVYDLEIWKVA